MTARTLQEIAADTPPSLTERKRAAILQVALAVFLQGGYRATSMDEIADRAQVSKQTVYRQFTDKATLFRHVAAATIAPMHESLQALLDTADTATDLRAGLRSAARRLVEIVTSAEIVQLRRIIIAEADRFPDVAQQWFELGPAQTVTRLAAWFTTLADTGKLIIDDPNLAAEQFLWLTISTPLNALMFAPSGTTYPPGKAHHYADAAVETFLAAYGPRQPSRA